MLKKFDEFNQELNEGFWDWLTGKSETGDSKKPKKSKDDGPGITDSTTKAYYKTLQDFADSGKSIAVQKYGTMEYSKMVEDIQIALKFLGYPLTQYGVDGYFGKETFDSIAKFNADTVSKK
jgi:peptidoglycan hydrolase-like protein with peptidoglycan-binding domain